MNVDEALRAFGAEGVFPRDAMEWALSHWDEAAPRFVSKLRAAAAKGEVAPEDESAMFYVAHLCGDHGETRAYEPLCRLAATDKTIEDWLGDGLTENLPGILIKTFDGDPQPLMQAIESPGADELARASALAALGYLVQVKVALPLDEMRAWLGRLARNRGIEGDFVFWEVWASFAAHFGFVELRPEVERLNRTGQLDPKEFDAREFDSIVRRVRANPADVLELERFCARPYEGAVATLQDWTSGDDRMGEDEPSDTPPPLDAPHRNPFRDIGRNDPCPCGSGKKYKKCCLVEEP